ncbi:hypothetical protein AB205_0059640 [Aquarana catesbeiana]|uniref:Uncharacterized protein n=1 Tax=Aquarana catesbeiana TaxID=8400 RepID=A0A2G9SBW9_AQUCT|nr:hypothetical protein AB205_0059640 [Aquarana catesbeiana]
MKQYKDFILRMKATLEKDTELTHLQKTIQGCPVSCNCMSINYSRPFVTFYIQDGLFC